MRKRWFMWLCSDGRVQGIDVPFESLNMRDFIYSNLEPNHATLWLHARTFDGAKQQAKEYFVDMFLTGVWK